MNGNFEHFAYAVSEVYRYWFETASEQLKEYGLKSGCAVYLSALQKYKEGLSCSSLCQLCAKDKADVCRCVARMEEKGLVKKKDESVKYRALIVLTEKGEELASRIAETARGIVEKSAVGIDEEDLESFYAVLYAISSNLKSKKGKRPF